MGLAMNQGLVKTFHRLTLSSYLESFINRFKTSSNLLNNSQNSVVSYRVTLEKGKVFRVPLECREILVLSGIAWLTIEGKDIILNSGDKASLASNKDLALLSVLGNIPLILDVL